VTMVRETLFLCGRVLRNLSRQPIWIVVMIVQPMFWLLLYSQLFRRITELPGFGTSSYIDYLTPGVAVMTAFFSGSWAGMGMIEDLDRGVVERFLATPAARSSLILGHVLMSATTAMVQTLIILGIGLAMGAHIEQGVAGWLVISRNDVGRWVGLVIAVISMIVSFLAIGAYPWWAIMTVVMNGIVVYGLTARWEK